MALARTPLPNDPERAIDFLKVGDIIQFAPGRSPSAETFGLCLNSENPLRVISLRDENGVSRVQATDTVTAKYYTCSCSELRYFDIVVDPSLTVTTSGSSSQSPSSSSTPFMSSSIIDFFKNMNATPDEKLLKEYGLEDPIGTPTAKGLELSALINYRANRDAVIATAKQMKAEEDAKKKE